MTVRFSGKFDWSRRPNRLSALTAARRSAGAPILDLTQSNPTRAGLEYDPGLIAALAGPRAAQYDPEPAGIAAAREAVSAYYRAGGIEAGPERILLTASTSEAYGYLFKLLADPGDEVLVPAPSYPLFDLLARMENVRLRYYPLVYQEGWWLDLDGLRAALTERTRAILVVNPNNPTGSYLKRDELERLAGLCSSRGIPLIADEVFAGYDFGPDPRRVRTLAEIDNILVFVLGGLSKTAGLPQMKLAWILAAGPAELRRQALERLEWVSDTYLSVSTPVQWAAARWLEGARAFQARLRVRLLGNLGHLKEAARGTECRVLDVEGGWYATVRLPRTLPEEEWALALLERDDVLVQPGYFYDFPDEPYAVLSLLTAPGVFREGAGRLLARVREGGA